MRGRLLSPIHTALVAGPFARNLQVGYPRGPEPTTVVPVAVEDGSLEAILLVSYDGNPFNENISRIEVREEILKHPTTFKTVEAAAHMQHSTWGLLVPADSSGSHMHHPSEFVSDAPLSIATRNTSSLLTLASLCQSPTLHKRKRTFLEQLLYRPRKRRSCSRVLRLPRRLGGVVNDACARGRFPARKRQIRDISLWRAGRCDEPRASGTRHRAALLCAPAREGGHGFVEAWAMGHFAGLHIDPALPVGG